jgi:predicted DNA-binding protein (MmcQ/YjbR family)
VTPSANKPSDRRPAPTRSLASASKTLRRFALSFPEAAEDFPWGERVAKVRGKIFAAFGADPIPGGPMSLTVKLPESHEGALDLPFTQPAGYGLGKSGWVTATFAAQEEPPLEILRAWIAESYRAVAPKKLVGSRPLTSARRPARARER